MGLDPRRREAGGARAALSGGLLLAGRPGLAARPSGPGGGQRAVPPRAPSSLRSPPPPSSSTSRCRGTSSCSPSAPARRCPDLLGRLEDSVVLGWASAAATVIVAAVGLGGLTPVPGDRLAGRARRRRLRAPAATAGGRVGGAATRRAARRPRRRRWPQRRRPARSTTPSARAHAGPGRRRRRPSCWSSWPTDAGPAPAAVAGAALDRRRGRWPGRTWTQLDRRQSPGSPRPPTFALVEAAGLLLRRDPFWAGPLDGVRGRRRGRGLVVAPLPCSRRWCCR